MAGYFPNAPLKKLNGHTTHYCFPVIHYAEVIREIDADMHALGKEKIQAENAKLRPVLENMLKRKKQ